MGGEGGLASQQLAEARCFEHAPPVRRQAWSPVDGHPFLDAGVVSWNEMRDRKVAGRPMTFIKKMVRECGGGP